MTPGTGPGRGRPWWRTILVLTLRPDPPRWPEFNPPRPGRVIAVVGRPR